MTEHREQSLPCIEQDEINLAIEKALAKAALEDLEVAQYPYFSPRRLGATAPHHPEFWSADYRDDGSDAIDPSSFDPPLRTLDDPDILDQLRGLLDAGLRIPPT